MRAMRARLNLSQSQVALAMTHRGFAWHQTTVAKTESGERALRLDEASALAGVLGVEVTDLLPSKHLTDAECAAEYWRAKADLATIEAVLVSPAAMNARVRVWHRFATQPHASEVEA